MAIPYYHVDAFTSELFAGNPAGVCILSAFPPDSIMQKIAAENRHSETAFVVPRADGDFDLRWFTPKVEDDLCGHATLASAYVLALRKHKVWPVRFHTRGGMLTVAQGKNEDSFEMDFPANPPQPCETPVGLLSALGLNAALVMKSRDYLVVVHQAEQVRALSPDIAALAKLDAGSGTIVTANGEGDVDYVCRMFLPSAGIDEDPATGSIHCTLAPYWAGRLPCLGRCALEPTLHKPQRLKVKIDNFSFSSATITVTAGTTVTWINRDDIPHKVVSNSEEFKSKVLDTDEKFSYTFSKAGIYPYYCSLHPKMTGKVIVQ